LNIQDLKYIIEFPTAQPIYYFFPNIKGRREFNPVGSPLSTGVIDYYDGPYYASDGLKSIAVVSRLGVPELPDEKIYLSEPQVKNYVVMPNGY